MPLDAGYYLTIDSNFASWYLATALYAGLWFFQRRIEKFDHEDGLKLMAIHVEGEVAHGFETAAGIKPRSAMRGIHKNISKHGGGNHCLQVIQQGSAYSLALMLRRNIQ